MAGFAKGLETFGRSAANNPLSDDPEDNPDRDATFCLATTHPITISNLNEIRMLKFAHLSNAKNPAEINFEERIV